MDETYRLSFPASEELWNQYSDGLCFNDELLKYLYIFSWQVFHHKPSRANMNDFQNSGIYLSLISSTTSLYFHFHFNISSRRPAKGPLLKHKAYRCMNTFYLWRSFQNPYFKTERSATFLLFEHKLQINNKFVSSVLIELRSQSRSQQFHNQQRNVSQQ